MEGGFVGNKNDLAIKSALRQKIIALYHCIHGMNLCKFPWKHFKTELHQPHIIIIIIITFYVFSSITMYKMYFIFTNNSNNIVNLK